MTQSQLYHQVLSLSKKTLSGWENQPLNAEQTAALDSEDARLAPDLSPDCHVANYGVSLSTWHLGLTDWLTEALRTAQTNKFR
jgi:hypothetical protein